jgi:hypothetical protein
LVLFCYHNVGALDLFHFGVEVWNIVYKQNKLINIYIGDLEFVIGFYGIHSIAWKANS